MSVYLVIRAYNTSTTVALSLSNMLIYVHFAELRPLLEIHCDTNNFKRIPAWGYEFLLSRGAKDCLAMISESNHLNEWALEKGKQKTNCLKKQESKQRLKTSENNKS